MRLALESGVRFLKFDHSFDDPFTVDVWLNDQPVWTLMVAEKSVDDKLILIFPALPKEHLSYYVEVTPSDYESPHKVVAPSRALEQLVAEFRLSKDGLASSGRPVSEVVNEEVQG